MMSTPQSSWAQRIAYGIDHKLALLARQTEIILHLLLQALTRPL